MFALSRLSRSGFLLLAFTGSVGDSFASDVEVDPLLGYHSDNTTHGLYEIREEVREFISRENAKNKTNWVVGDPDIRMYAPRCAVPLRIKWRHDERRRSVDVICTRTVKGSYEKEWDLPVPIRAAKSS
ncbi:hypothetical protein [Pseudoduganella sp. HUAS MS19]